MKRRLGAQSLSITIAPSFSSSSMTTLSLWEASALKLACILLRFKLCSGSSSKLLFRFVPLDSGWPFVWPLVVAVGTILGLRLMSSAAGSCTGLESSGRDLPWSVSVTLSGVTSWLTSRILTRRG